MGKFSKSKGYRVEAKLVKEFVKHGIKARRQPMSGAIPDFPYDIEIRQEPGNIYLFIKSTEFLYKSNFWSL